MPVEILEMVEIPATTPLITETGIWAESCEILSALIWTVFIKLVVPMANEFLPAVNALNLITISWPGPSDPRLIPEVAIPFLVIAPLTLVLLSM